MDKCRDGNELKLEVSEPDLETPNSVFEDKKPSPLNSPPSWTKPSISVSSDSGAYLQGREEMKEKEEVREMPAILRMLDIRSRPENSIILSSFKVCMC